MDGESVLSLVWDIVASVYSLLIVVENEGIPKQIPVSDFFKLHRLTVWTRQFNRFDWHGNGVGHIFNGEMNVLAGFQSTRFVQFHGWRGFIDHMNWHESSVVVSGCNAHIVAAVAAEVVLVQRNGDGAYGLTVCFAGVGAFGEFQVFVEGVFIFIECNKLDIAAFVCCCVKPGFIFSGFISKLDDDIAGAFAADFGSCAVISRYVGIFFATQIERGFAWFRADIAFSERVSVWLSPSLVAVS